MCYRAIHGESAHIPIHNELWGAIEPEASFLRDGVREKLVRAMPLRIGLCMRYVRMSFGRGMEDGAELSATTANFNSVLGPQRRFMQTYSPVYL